MNLLSSSTLSLLFMMRLLRLTENGKFSLTKDIITDIPKYAILSHTWGDDDDEVTFRDMIEGLGQDKAGYRKILFCGQQAIRDNLEYFWADTCCIDKSNYTELSEAITSMFRWYRNASKCYVYLEDVSTNGHDQINQSFWEPAFRRCRWFTRGWALQELIAPPSVEFFSREGKFLGSKKSLEIQIHEITGIRPEALLGHDLSTFSLRERLSWAGNRETKREEDKAYSLLGIFDVSMPPLYGEGIQNAFRRLKDEIHKRARNSHLDELPDGSHTTFTSTERDGTNNQWVTVPSHHDADFIDGGRLGSEIFISAVQPRTLVGSREFGAASQPYNPGETNNAEMYLIRLGTSSINPAGGMYSLRCTVSEAYTFQEINMR